MYQAVSITSSSPRSRARNRSCTTTARHDDADHLLLVGPSMMFRLVGLVGFADQQNFMARSVSAAFRNDVQSLIQHALVGRCRRPGAAVWRRRSGRSNHRPCRRRVDHDLSSCAAEDHQNVDIRFKTVSFSMARSMPPGRNVLGTQLGTPSAISAQPSVTVLITARAGSS